MGVTQEQLSDQTQQHVSKLFRGTTQVQWAQKVTLESARARSCAASPLRMLHHWMRQLAILSLSLSVTGVAPPSTVVKIE